MSATTRLRPAVPAGTGVATRARRGGTWRAGRGLSVRVEGRTLGVCAGLVLALVVVVTLSLATGDYPLGVGVDRTRLTVLAAAVALTALAALAAGPVAFVALAAPQVARRLTGAVGSGLVAAGLTGALLLVVSDFAAQRLFAPVQLPVGVLTGAVGGLYLAYLLAGQWRRGRG